LSKASVVFVEIDLARFDRSGDFWRDRGRVDLEANGERGLRADAGPHAAVRRPLDRPVQLERVSPERLIAERLEPKHLLPLPEQGVSPHVGPTAGEGADRPIEPDRAEQQQRPEHPEHRQKAC
jgi:hypothetical protein